MKSTQVNPPSNVIPSKDQVVLKPQLLVVELRTERQMRVGEQLENGKYKCYAGGSYIGDFDSNEFMEFNQWVKEVYNKK